MPNELPPTASFTASGPGIARSPVHFDARASSDRDGTITYASPSHRRVLGYEPQVDFRQGLQELAEWLMDKVAEDRVDHATAELESRGLVA